jgi:hypothetical protein
VETAGYASCRLDGYWDRVDPFRVRVLRKAAKDLEAMGVDFVEGLDEDYDGHRYCEPSRMSSQMVDYNTWFWSPYAHFQTTSEGPGDPNSPYVASDSLDPA